MTGGTQRDGRGARRSRAPRHGLVRPTVGCLVLVACGAASCYAGLLLDERALMACVIVVSAMIVVSLIDAMAWWWLAGRRGGIRAEREPDSRRSAIVRRLRAAAGFVGPAHVEMTPLIERVDQYGDVVGRMQGPIPAERGLYRHVGTILRWRSLFGLFAVRRIVAASGETPVLPETPEPGRGRDQGVTPGRASGGADAEESGVVRAYTPGDPLNRVAWKHSARRGTLMTRELDGDARPTLLLAVNTLAGDGMDERRLDAAVAALLPYATSPHMRSSLVESSHTRSAAGVDVAVTDGVSTVEGVRGALRFLAAARTTDRGGTVQDRAATVAGYIRRSEGPVVTIVCDAADAHGFAQSLRTTPHIHAAIVPPQSAPVHIATPQQPFETMREEDVRDAARDASKRDGAGDERNMRGRSPHDRSGHGAVARPTLAMWRVWATRGAAALACCAILLDALTHLVEPTGIWAWYAAACLATASVASAVPCRTRRGTAMRVGAYIAAVASSCAVLVAMRIGDTGVADAATGTGAGTVDATATGTGATARLTDVLALGFDRLNLQLPPLRVVPASDVLLILVVAAAAVLIRCLLLWRRGILLLAPMAVVALAADYGMLGHVSPWWAVAVLAAAFPAGVWTVGAASAPRGMMRRRLGARLSSTRPPMPPVVAVLAIVATTLAATPSAETLAYRVPLSLGEGGGMFSSNTVSPLIDLKRNIAVGSDSVVLDYAAQRRLYLKLSTLDTFDGDTWGYDRDLAIDAGLYGSGIRLGRNQSDELTMEQRRVMDPLGIYMWAFGFLGWDADGSDGWGSSGWGSSGSSGTRGSSGSSDSGAAGDDAGGDPDALSAELGRRFEQTARVRITTLRSRFLPVPGMASEARGLGSAWLRYNDGSMVNRTGTTSRDMEYTVSGTYLDPITSAAGFSELEPVRSAADALETEAARILAQEDEEAADEPARGDGWRGDSRNGRRWMTRRLMAFVDEADSRAHGTRYTSLPGTLPDNVRAVVREARAAGVPTDGAGYDDQVRAMRWLVDYFTKESNHFTYSLDAPDGDGRSNMQVVDDFLDPDTGHAGYCQHYASALAVLARAMGVPTRIVLGYNAGTTERDGDGYYPVQSRQLHAWVEAYLDGVGWVPFDVTPPSESNGTLDADGSAAASDESSSDAGTDTTTDDAAGGAAAETGTDDAAAGASDDESGADASSDSSSAETSAEDSGGGAARSPAAWLARLPAAFMSMPPWVRAVTIGVVFAAMLVGIVFAPRAVRRARRRRCVVVARRAAACDGDAGGDGDDARRARDLRARAWRMAWERIRRDGRIYGARWDAAETDLMIAERIADAWPVGRGGDARGAGAAEAGAVGDTDARPARDARRVIRDVAKGADATAFGGEAPVIGRLADDLESLFATTRR